MGTCNYAIIKRIKETLQIPVICNGGVSTFADVERAFALTGCDGVMSSESILEYAALFDPSKIHDMDDIALEYLEMCEKYPGERNCSIVRAHMFKFLHTGLSIHTDLRDKLAKVHEIEEFREIALDMK
jgi:tRNA-dihydrouridine synthase 1